VPPLTQLRLNPRKGNVLAMSSRSSQRATTKIKLKFTFSRRLDERKNLHHKRVAVSC